MKLGRWELPGRRTFWGVLSTDESRVTELSGSFESWAPVLSMAAKAPQSHLGATHDAADLIVRAPLNPGARIWAVGSNYMNHMKREDPPGEPLGFMKPESAIVDPGGAIRFPAHTNELDYEVELVLVMATGLTRGRDPRNSLLGYTIGNDGSIRDHGRITGVRDMYSAKSEDQLSPVGPHVVTLRTVGGPIQPDLLMTTYVNGELRQKDRTKDMVFPVDYVLKWVNERNELRPGDLVYTGTPQGTCIDAGHSYLTGGDAVVMEIECIGTLTFTVSDKSSPRT